MANISYSELTSALEKAGLPLSGKKQMQEALPYARGAIQTAVQSQDTQLPQYNAEYKAKLAKLAEMDQKLAPMYSDPSSSMYIERASTRDNILGGAENVGLQDLSSTGQKILNRQKEIEQQQQDALTFFRDLISAQPGGGSMDDIAALMKIFGQDQETPTADPSASVTDISPDSEDYGFKNVTPRGLESMTFNEGEDPLSALYADSVLEDLYNKHTNK